MERWLINLLVGLHVLGLFFHAQQYRAAITSIIKIPIKGLWQTTLSEAMAPQPTFTKLRPVWAWIDNLVFVVGFMFILVGGELLGLLTHGKFSDAAPFAAVWMAITLMQNAGRPFASLLIARGEAVKFGRICLKTTLAVMISTPLAMWMFDLWGVFVAITVGAILYWVLVQHEAKLISDIRFSDLRPFWLAAIIIAAVVATYYFQPTLVIRLVALTLIIGGFIIGVLRSEVISDLFKVLRNSQRQITKPNNN